MIIKYIVCIQMMYRRSYNGIRDVILKITKLYNYY